MIFVRRDRRPLWMRAAALVSWCAVAYVALSALSLGRVVWSWLR
ncbi:hypothetical protein [Chitinimonas lacunae]|uniref:DUF2474 domain-containing protein n=1 Tax=Chitinimonas lacunae TaxID=1963018 RepID=A0ABV8MWD9_9NEIS